jgi:hypothetical protein
MTRRLSRGNDARLTPTEQSATGGSADRYRRPTWLSDTKVVYRRESYAARKQIVLSMHLSAKQLDLGSLVEFSHEALGAHSPECHRAHSRHDVLVGDLGNARSGSSLTPSTATRRPCRRLSSLPRRTLTVGKRPLQPTLRFLHAEDTTHRIGVTLQREGMRNQDMGIHISLLTLPCLNSFGLYPS